MKIIKILFLILLGSSTSAQVNIDIIGDTLVNNIENSPENIRDHFKAELSRSNYYHPQNITNPYHFISDYENLFSEEEETILDSIVNNFEKHTSIEIAIITLDTILVANKNFEELTLLIAQKWEIGKKEKNNGILIAISSEYRRMRIQNGFGIEKQLTDFQTKNIIDNVITPFYKNGEYFNGTKAGLIDIINTLK